ncbi:MAG: cohesin domain-containing protein [Chloroflexi bacterium]|nr:cohesin domain-containing protein [Chloroflexota bacterium]MBU1750490.1 cohesin domain-containing protein [Chloroflexota bacterium]
MTHKRRLVQVGIVLGLLLGLAAGVVHAQTAVVRVEPAIQYVALSSPGTVDIMIDDAVDLGGFQFDLTFDATLMQVDSVALGSFLGSTGRTAFPVGPTIDNVNGLVTFGGASFGANPGPNGTGTLATVNFHTLGTPGASRLELENVQVLDTSASPQASTTVDGGVNIGSTAVAMAGLTALGGPGAMTGLVLVGGLVGLAVASAGTWWMWRRRVRQR